MVSTPLSNSRQNRTSLDSQASGRSEFSTWRTYFRSKFFGEKPIKRLLDAANDNPSHITPGSSGDHVSQIQAALFAIDSAAIDADELGKSLYGPFTAKAVAAFRTSACRRPPFSTRKWSQPTISTSTSR
jgi:hypothetical protein